MAGDKELGEALRAAREEAGLTLAALAKHARYSPKHLGNIERGLRSIPADVPLAYQKAIAEADMDRRGILTGVAAAAIAPQATNELLRRGFTAALRRDPSVDEWRHRLNAYGEQYMTNGAGEVQRTLAADLVTMPRALGTPQMWSVAAKALAIYGKTTAGPKEAIAWYRTASTAADRSGDVETRVWIAGRASLALGYEGAAPPTAYAFAEQALQLSDQPTPGRLNALMGKAHVHAQRGQAADARAAWEEVQRVFDAISPDETISDFVYPYWRLCVVGSLLFSRLGDASAQSWQDAVDAYRPDAMVRFGAHVELHRALMMAKDGDRPSGVAYAQAALDRLPGNKISQSLVLMMNEIKAVPAR